MQRPINVWCSSPRFPQCQTDECAMTACSRPRAWSSGAVLPGLILYKLRITYFIPKKWELLVQSEPCGGASREK